MTDNAPHQRELRDIYTRLAEIGHRLVIDHVRSAVADYPPGADIDGYADERAIDAQLTPEAATAVMLTATDADTDAAFDDAEDGDDRTRLLRTILANRVVVALEALYLVGN